jgi:hypothetical protein
MAVGGHFCLWGPQIAQSILQKLILNVKLLQVAPSNDAIKGSGVLRLFLKPTVF